MPVTLQTPYTPPAPNFDKVHLEHLVISLEKTNYAKTQISARFCLYALDENNNKIFSDEKWEIFIEDAAAFMLDLAQNGDMRGVQADESIRQLVAFLVETKTNLGVATPQ